MMKNVLRVIVTLAVLLNIGCIGAGRFALIDIDLRTPEQIKAYAAEARYVYEDINVIENEDIEEGEEVEPKAISGIIPSILDKLRVFKCRFRILGFEWRK
jgi:hypothetical protein